MKKFLIVSSIIIILFIEGSIHEKHTREKFYHKINSKYPHDLIDFKQGEIVLIHSQKGYSFMIVKIENILDTFYDIKNYIPNFESPKTNLKKIPIIKYDYIEYYPVFTRKEFVESGLKMPDSLFRLIPYD